VFKCDFSLSPTLSSRILTWDPFLFRIERLGYHHRRPLRRHLGHCRPDYRDMSWFPLIINLSRLSSEIIGSRRTTAAFESINAHLSSAPPLNPLRKFRRSTPVAESSPISHSIPFSTSTPSSESFISPNSLACLIKLLKIWRGKQ